MVVLGRQYLLGFNYYQMAIGRHRSNLLTSWVYGFPLLENCKNVKQDPAVKQLEGHVDKIISNFFSISISLKLFLHIIVYSA